MSLPSGYKRLDYIQSSGTQYINSGVYSLSYSLMVKLGFDITELTSNMGIIAARDTSGDRTYPIGVYNGAWRCSWYSEQTGGTAVADTHYEAQAYCYNGKQQLTINDTVVVNKTTTSSSIGSRQYSIFANNYDGTITNYSSIRLYYCQMYDGSTLVRDFIPAMRESDNEVGLYDLVNDIFYTNQGTDSFTYGMVIGDENITFTDNPLSLTIGEDTEITANFKKLNSKKYIIGV